MPYIGKSPSQATRKRYYKTASGSETSISGTMTVGGTLTFTDGEFVDVSVNGVALVAGTDYNTNTANTIAGLSALSANDQVEIVVYDTFSVFSGDVDSNFSVGGNLSVTGTSTFSSDVDLQGSAGATLKLTSTDTSGADTELLGQIDFVSSDSSTGSAGTQARIKGVYEDNGDSSGLEFFCGASTGSGTPTLFKRMILSHDGEDPAASIITDDNVANLALISTDADASVGPVLELVRNSGSPADSDLLGSINFIGNDDGGNETTFASVSTQIGDASNGTESCGLQIKAMSGGSLVSRADFLVSETVFNNGSIDLDFRVESDGNANMLFVDAGNNKVGIGTGSPHSGLTCTADVDGTPGSNGVGVGMSGNNAALKMSGSDGGFIDFNNAADGSEYKSRIIHSASDNSLKFFVNGAGSATFAIESAGNSGFVRSGGVVLNVNRNSDDGALISLQQGSVTEGLISVSGTTVTYGGFSGSHWSRLSDNSKPTILRGTVIETIDQMCTWYQAEYEYNGETKKESIALPEGKSVGDTFTYEPTMLNLDEKITVTAKIIQEDDVKHAMCKISDTADSKKVYGVFLDWDNDEVDQVNDMNICSVGTNVVRIHKDVTVEAGDLLSSNGDGTAKVQDDDIIRSKTIGKVLAVVKQETYSDGSYTVPCALYCG